MDLVFEYVLDDVTADTEREPEMPRVYKKSKSSHYVVNCDFIFETTFGCPAPLNFITKFIASLISSMAVVCDESRFMFSSMIQCRHGCKLL